MAAPSATAAPSAAPGPQLVSEHACHGGVQRFYRHASQAVGLPMRFSIFLPPADVFVAASGRLPALVWLAGFWLDATREPWSRHWRMESWLGELLALLPQQFAVDPDRIGLFGHSMGGHGALTLALRHPGRFRTLSAFAPICAPMRCPWGLKAFSGYLGDDRAAWAQHDACELMARQSRPPYPRGILIDQGLADAFLAQQLHPHFFEVACAQVRQPLTLRRHAAYDHGYYFIKTFMEDHLRFHAQGLGVLPRGVEAGDGPTF